MKILHVLKSEPDGAVRRLIDALSEGKEAEEVRLFDEAPDYGDLVRRIFESEKVLSWW